MERGAFSKVGEALFKRKLEKRETGGPIAWCPTCSRFHPRRKHQLFLRERMTRGVGGRKSRRRNASYARRVWAP